MLPRWRSAAKTKYCLQKGSFIRSETRVLLHECTASPVKLLRQRSRGSFVVPDYGMLPQLKCEALLNSAVADLVVHPIIRKYSLV